MKLPRTRRRGRMPLNVNGDKEEVEEVIGR